jgi:hypothetical protein
MRRLFALVTAASLALAACSSGSESELPTDPIRTESKAADAPTALAPLTGLQSTDTDVATRPAVTVKIDNAPKARPQSGLDVADVVFEEKVEGSVVRFLSVFQSKEADSVGPIRSLRSTDPPIVTPLGGVFAYSGGVAAFKRDLKTVPVTVVSEENRAEAFSYRADRQRPWKTYASTKKLRSYVKKGTGPPPALFSFRGADEAAAGSPVRKATVVYGSLTTAQWDWDATAGKWLRTTNGTPHEIEGGKRLAFENVIVQLVPYQRTAIKDVSGAPVDEAIVIGSGDAIVLSGGRMVKARWTKGAESSVTTYTTADGEPVKLSPGQTWVMLPAVGSPVSTS